MGTVMQVAVEEGSEVPADWGQTGVYIRGSGAIAVTLWLRRSLRVSES